jgi:hypothetical protein
MGKVGTYFHDSLNVTEVASIGTTFDVTKFHLHDLIPDQTFPNSAPNRFPGVTRKTLFNNRIEGLHVRLTSIAGGAANVTCRITADAAGDFVLMPDTEAAISTGDHHHHLRVRGLLHRHPLLRHRQLRLEVLPLGEDRCWDGDLGPVLHHLERVSHADRSSLP